MMEHKAFLFDYDSFVAELRPILGNALLSKDPTSLVEFIEANRNSLSDPYEGRPLTPSWSYLVEYADAHQYGDFALTKYYDPAADIGLGDDWQVVQDLFALEPLLDWSPILGETIGPDDAPFDPGKYGSYFQSRSMVRRGCEWLRKIPQTFPANELKQAVEMLEKAVNANTGLYITF